MTRRQVSGTKHSATSIQRTSQSVPVSERNSPHPDNHSDPSLQKGESEYGSESSTFYDESLEHTPVRVVARVSSHILREERAFHLCKTLLKSVGSNHNHIIRPIAIVKLSSAQGDKCPLVVCIFEHPGSNYLPKVVDYGPAWYRSRMVEDKYAAFREEFTPTEPVPLQTFMDFAVGSIECLATLHHGQRIVHGEIRGDAFHMNIETGDVKLINFGSGLRTFEHGLTSTGWSTLSKEVGAKTKLSYMSPEQTGRMPAEPDSRTDIYSLGILFWTMLTQQAAFDGNSPMDIIQGVLGRRLPSVGSMRMDIPDVISRIIQKMTAKTIGDRYHSASGLRHDLIEVRRLLGDGNSGALKNWEIATKDVSSFFILPTVMVGRSDEHDEIVKIIDKVSRRHVVTQMQDVSSISSGSNLSESHLENFNAALGALGELSSEGDNTSSADRKSMGKPGAILAELKSFQSRSGQGLPRGSMRNSVDSQKSVRSNDPGTPLAGLSSHRVSPTHSRSAANSMHNSNDSYEHGQHSQTSSNGVKSWDAGELQFAEGRSQEGNSSVGPQSASDGVGSLSRNRNTQKFRRKGRCEIVSISGAAGLGKSCLVQSVQVEARRRGYFASSKFDQTKKTPFGPVLKLLSSLFKQVFSESNTDTAFHKMLKQYVRPGWPMLHKILALPEFLLGPMMMPPHKASTNSNETFSGYNSSLRTDVLKRDSSPSSSQASQSHLSTQFSLALGAQSSQDFLRAGSSTKSMRLMNTFLDVLRVFTQYKFICFCLDDLQFADDESLDLITQIIASKMKMVIIVTYRPDEILPERIKGILEPPNTEGISLHSPSTNGCQS